MTNIKSSDLCQVKKDMISFSGVNNLFLFFNIKGTLERARITKSKGIQNVLILLYLCLLHFKGRRSITEGLQFLEKQVHKSTVHNFLNDTTYDWRKLLTHTAKVYHKRFPADSGKPTVFIIDDTSKEKTGRFVEFIGKFRDHCNGCFYMGYQVIFGGISNGQTCIPIDFTIKISNPKKSKKKNKKNRKMWKQGKYGKGKYPRNSHTSKRIAEAKETKFDLCVTIEILELYAYRWQIEVMIKDLKQHFGFYRSMSTKYAPQVADLSINCMFYVMICTLKEHKPKKSSYQLLLDLQFEFEEYCYEMFFAYKFRTKTVEFVDFAMSKGLTYISELRALMNALLDEFLSKEFYDDKIVEVDTSQNDTVA
ncbi:MAG: transposase [Candidatus Cloacimonetes bacterium]|nr:transposase [Candidatus Cloacimonadota bacterium]